MEVIAKEIFVEIIDVDYVYDVLDYSLREGIVAVSKVVYYSVPPVNYITVTDLDDFAW